MTKKKSKNVFRVLLFVGTAISLYFVPWPIVIAWATPLPTTVRQQVEKAYDYGFDGIVVYVDKKGQAPIWYTSGYKNKEQQIPADPHALFKIASVGKLYDALTLTKMVTDGLLSLDSTLADYLPELEGRIAHADRITLRMMVQHRSGIPNYTDTPNYWAAPKATFDENLALVLDMPADFEPGSAYAYCNTNYLLLNRIMQRVLDYDRFQYMRERILIPLELHNTYSSLDEVNIDDVMSGYYVGYELDLKTEKVGSMLTTSEDLGKFIRALNDGSVFSDQKEQALYSSIYRFEHTGLIPGYQTIARYHPDIHTVVIQFTNTVDFQGYNWSLSEVMYDRIVKIISKQ